MILKQYGVSEKEVAEYFYSVCDRVSDSEELKAIFSVALNGGDFALFPYLSLNLSDYKQYIDAWIDLYVSARRCNPSNYKAPQKTVCDDLSVVKIITSACGIPYGEAYGQLKAHNRYMSAEGVQGYLLEEYVASVAQSHGFLYCSKILRCVDFSTPDGKILLQIKNKKNAEPAPSVKTGASIKRWFRVKAIKRKGKTEYVNNWAELNNIISAASGRQCNMCEEDFLTFIEIAVKGNSGILGDI